MAEQYPKGWELLTKYSFAETFETQITHKEIVVTEFLRAIRNDELPITAMAPTPADEGVVEQSWYFNFNTYKANRTLVVAGEFVAGLIQLEAVGLIEVKFINEKLDY